MTSGRVFLLAALYSFFILTTFIDSTESARCCLQYSRKHLKCSRMLGYTIQTNTASCDIEAVIFHAKGKFICADPLSSHTQKLKMCIDGRRSKSASNRKPK
ncbi:C-C motif chemokine 20b [Labrus bergylta]|uniref:C-C motif chemokine n=1 Tax=Labrus bergylta TaxID=56723 RepID=A0A3Q3FM90_9LABR|nr:C-C motif chemokine 20-like [Labrus bergylta]